MSDLKLYNFVLNERQICDLELLLNGGFKPLKGFMTQDDYDSVLDNMCLSNGKLWPIPIILDINKKIKDEHNLMVNSRIALKDHEGFLVAFLNITDIWEADKKREALAVFNTDSLEHPGVYQLLNNTNKYYHP